MTAFNDRARRGEVVRGGTLPLPTPFERGNGIPRGIDQGVAEEAVPLRKIARVVGHRLEVPDVAVRTGRRSMDTVPSFFDPQSPDRRLSNVFRRNWAAGLRGPVCSLHACSANRMAPMDTIATIRSDARRSG